MTSAKGVRFFIRLMQSDDTDDPSGTSGFETAYYAIKAKEIQQAAILNAVATTARDSIFCKDLQRRYTFVNPAMAEVLGLSPDSLVGRTPEEIFDPEFAATVREVDELNLAGAIVDEIRALAVGNDEIHFHTVQVPIRNDVGDIAGICGIVRDVTESVRATEELERHRENLEELVAERTAELIRARDLLQQQLEENQALERHLAMTRTQERARMGRELHDSLGQVLTGMHFKIAALRRSLADAGIDHESEVADLERLAIRALKEVKMIARGVMPVELGDEGLAGALGRLVETVSERTGIPCRLTGAEESQPLEIDAEMAFELFSIAKEAINNAVQHSQSASVSVSIARPETHRVVIRVRDWGIGFCPGAPSEGSGLRIMNYRAQNIGAVLQVESQPGKGTEVACCLSL